MSRTRPTYGPVNASNVGKYNLRPLERRDRGTERHLVADVRYRWAREHGLPMGRAPLTCTCGWDGLAGGFPEHRLAMGSRVGES